MSRHAAMNARRDKRGWRLLDVPTEEAGVELRRRRNMLPEKMVRNKRLA
jgi:hypothetical protein